MSVLKVNLARWDSARITVPSLLRVLMNLVSINAHALLESFLPAMQILQT